MRVGTGDNIYEWIEDWAKTPDTESARTGCSHHGIVVSESGEVYSGHQDAPIVQVFDTDGELLRSWPSNCADTHGLTLVNEGGTEYLWIADNGAKRHPSTAYEYPDTDTQVTGKAVKKTMDGQTLLELATPPLATYR